MAPPQRMAKHFLVRTALVADVAFGLRQFLPLLWFFKVATDRKNGAGASGADRALVFNDARSSS